MNSVPSSADTVQPMFINGRPVFARDGESFPMVSPADGQVFGRVSRGMDVIDRIQQGDRILKATVLSGGTLVKGQP